MNSNHHRSGLSMVEVIVSVGVVAGLATIILAAVGMMENAALRDRYRLEAMEVAHRVVLQMVDDPGWLGDAVRRVEYNQSNYRFEVRRDILIEEEDVLAETGDGPSSARRSTMRFDDADMNQIIASQIIQVTVWVFREMSDGSFSEAPLAELARTYKPVLGLRKRGFICIHPLQGQMGGD